MLFPHLTSANVFNHEGQATFLSYLTKLVYNNLGNIVEKHESWEITSGKQELFSRFRTEDTIGWIINLPVELVETDATGRLLKLRRYFYDGDPFVGLSLGNVTTGNLARCEQMVITDSQATIVYGIQVPNFASLGFHRVIAPDGTEGWGTNTIRQDFDTRGNVTRRMDGFGNIGHVFFDSDGIFPTLIQDPLGHRYQSEYHIRAQEIVRITDPNGHEIRYRYDPVRRLKAMIKPGDSETFPTMQFEYWKKVYLLVYELVLGKR